MNTRKLIWVSALLVVALTLSACGAKATPEPTATPVDVNAVAAQAIQTFAMALTMTAFAQPTATFTPPPPPTTTAQPTFVLLTTGTAAVAAPTNSCYNSQWISDVSVPDGTPMAPGQQFTKTWLVKNTGTCNWEATFKVSFGGIGVPMGGQATPLGKIVKPGEQVEISVNLTAPATGGDLQSYWKLQDGNGAFFGTWLTVVIKVAGASANTATPTEEFPTATPTQ